MKPASSIQDPASYPFTGPIPAAVYRRVSTDHQDGSLALQEKRVNDYAQFSQLTIRDGLTFSDPDTSGRTPIMERNGGRALLNRLRVGDVKHVIVAKLDRLGRNAKDALGTLEFFEQHGVTLHITDLGGQSISTQGHMGKFILSILLCVAEWEASEIRDRTTKIMRGKFDRMELTGNVPFGFDAEYTFKDGHIEQVFSVYSAAQLVDLESRHGACVSKLLVPNEPEQAVIRQLKAWRDVERLPGVPTSYTTVAAQANAAGYRTKQGGEWQCGHVTSVLNNRHTQRLLAKAPVESDMLHVEGSELATSNQQPAT